MSKKTVKVQATFIYELEVDTESFYVKDYNSEQEMIEDLVHYRFSTLPVIGKGIEIKDVEVGTYEVVY